MNFSDRLKEARKNAGLTQAQLSKKLGITAQGYSQYETGKRNPKFETVKKIAMALEIDVCDLFIDCKHLSRENNSEITRSSQDNDGWIPVEERLPENEHSVLMCGNPGWIDVGWFIRGVWRTGFSAAEIRNEVVAWRPLPDPYRPEREVSCDER